MARRRFPVRALVLVVVIIIAVAAGLWWYRTFEGDPYVTHAKYQGMLDDVAKDFGANALVTQLSLEKHGGDVTALTDGRRVQAGTSYGVGGNKT
jgi:hypothetical protein